MSRLKWRQRWSAAAWDTAGKLKGRRLWRSSPGCAERKLISGVFPIVDKMPSSMILTFSGPDHRSGHYQSHFSQHCYSATEAIFTALFICVFRKAETQDFAPLLATDN